MFCSRTTKYTLLIADILYTFHFYASSNKFQRVTIFMVAKVCDYCFCFYVLHKDNKIHAVDCRHFVHLFIYEAN